MGVLGAVMGPSWAAMLARLGHLGVILWASGANQKRTREKANTIDNNGTLLLVICVPGCFEWGPAATLSFLGNWVGGLASWRSVCSYLEPSWAVIKPLTPLTPLAPQGALKLQMQLTP